MMQPCFVLGTTPMMPRSVGGAQTGTCVGVRSSVVRGVTSFHGQRLRSRAHITADANKGSLENPTRRGYKMVSNDKIEITEEHRQLFEEQAASPIFDASAISGKVGDLIRSAQPPQPPYQFLNSKDIHKASQLVTDHHIAAVTAARTAILKIYPGIDQPGGKLYPKFRSDACWRDLNSFLRVVGYTCAVGSEEGLSEKGFAVLKKAYGILEVPVPALIAGLHSLWAYCLSVALDDVGADDRDMNVNVTEEKQEVCERLDLGFKALISRLSELVEARAV